MVSVQTIKQPINNPFIIVEKINNRDEKLIKELSDRILKQPANKLNMIIEVRLFASEIIIMAFEQAIVTLEEDSASNERVVNFKKIRDKFIVNKIYYTSFIVIGCNCDLAIALQVLDAKLASNN